MLVSHPREVVEHESLRCYVKTPEYHLPEVPDPRNPLDFGALPLPFAELVPFAAPVPFAGLGSCRASSGAALAAKTRDKRRNVLETIVSVEVTTVQSDG
jgi:hypothetical protein